MRNKICVIIFTALTLLLCAQYVHATDVTILNTSIPGVQPLNLPPSRALSAVTVTSGSASITCNACFLPNTVSLTGFTINLGGTNYVDVTITSTSAATLGSTYSGTTGTVAGTFYSYVWIRWYPTAAFQPNGATYIIQPGNVDTLQYYKQYAASVINGTVQITTMVIPATTDAPLNNQAKWVMGLYLPIGLGVKINVVICPSNVTQWSIPPQTPTTLTAICSWNFPPANVPPNNEAYTKPQIDTRFPSCAAANSMFYQVPGNVLQCLNFGSGLVLSGNTLSSTGGSGGGYSIIQGNGTGVTQRSIMNFIGSSLTVADNAPTTTTTITAAPNLNALASNAGTGLWAVTGSGTGAARSLVAPASGITITNSDGVAGAPTFALANSLSALQGLSTTGLVTRTATDTFATSTITGTSGNIVVTNGNGVAGNPTINLDPTVAHLVSCSSGQSLYYNATGTAQSCLTFGSGLTLTGGTLSASGGGGGGYTTIQGNGTAVTQRSILNFNNAVASDFTVADNSGSTRTDVSLGTNIARLNTAQTWTGNQTFTAGTLNIGSATTNPASPTAGTTYFNSTIGLPLFNNGTNFITFPSQLFQSFADTAVTAGATIFTIPANTMRNNGDTITVSLAGVFNATSTGGPNWIVSVGGVNLTSYAVSMTAISAGSWYMNLSFTRTSATNIRGGGSINLYAVATNYPIPQENIDMGDRTVTLSSSMAIIVTNAMPGTGTSTLKTAVVNYIPAAQ